MYKPAYSLDESEKQFNDKNINISYPSDAGPTQKYINKQMACWYKYINKENLYEKINTILSWISKKVYEYYG